VSAPCLLAGKFDARSVLLAILVSIWALRLGSFLFLRIRQPGVDERFDAIKPSFTRFLMAWTLQGLWVFMTLAAALAAMTSAPLGLIGFVGTAIWAAGFAIEVSSSPRNGGATIPTSTLMQGKRRSCFRTLRADASAHRRVSSSIVFLPTASSQETLFREGCPFYHDHVRIIATNERQNFVMRKSSWNYP